MRLSQPTVQLFISITIAVSAAVLLDANRPPIPNPGLRRDWFWAMKTHETENLTLIVYGDSRVSQAVNTKPLLDVFPEAAPRNLGYAGAGFNPEMYTHLRRIVGNKGAEMVVMLGFTPYGLSTEANANQMFLQEWTRATAEVNERLKVYPVLGRFEPLTPSMFRDADQKQGMYITYHDDGWEEAYELPENPGKWLPVYERHFQRTQVDPANIEASYDFVRDCIREGVRVYGFRPPTTREMEALEDAQSGFREADFVEGFEKAGGVWLQVPDRFAYYSYDSCHLHKNAAKKFSRDLAAVLQTSATP